MILHSAIGGFLGSFYSLQEGWFAKASISSTAIFYYLVTEDLRVPTISIGILVLIDFISGIYKAIHTRTISSGGLSHGLGKIGAYILIVLAAIQASKSSEWLTWVPSVVYTYIALTELTSIIENLNHVGMKIPTLNKLYSLLTSDGRRKIIETMGVKISKEIITINMVENKVTKYSGNIFEAMNITDEMLSAPIVSIMSEKYVRKWTNLIESLRDQNDQEFVVFEYIDKDGVEHKVEAIVSAHNRKGKLEIKMALIKE